jgi:hypothetical protein
MAPIFQNNQYHTFHKVRKEFYHEYASLLSPATGVLDGRSYPARCCCINSIFPEVCGSVIDSANGME